MSEKIVTTPEFEARHAFDVEHNVEPCRTIAIRIAGEHGAHWTHPLVDDIAHAIEDARELGEKRAMALGTHLTGSRKSVNRRNATLRYRARPGMAGRFAFGHVGRET